MANIIESVKNCVGGATKATVDVTKSTTSATTGAVKTGVAATVDQTKAVANKAKELGQAGLNQTLKTLGATAAFQSVFGENIDKSDAGLTKAFNTVDVDSSGKISVKEMTAYIAQVYGGYAARTASNEVHNPLLLPSASIGSPLCLRLCTLCGHRELDESITKKMFEVADTDKDGEVDLKEFKAIMRAGPNTKPPAGSLPQSKTAGADTAWYKKCAPCQAASA